jgi:hypothetical protein
MVAVPFEPNSFDQFRINLVIILWGSAMNYCFSLDKNSPKSFTPVTDIYEASKAPDFF